MSAKEELTITKGPCGEPKTNYEVTWPYIQYYFGEKDEENRKYGPGENHWSGAQSLEWCRGNFLRDTMHGFGDYRSTYRGPTHMAYTYEGAFYNNDMHGYGTMSYCDGQVYNGLFHNNIRWGPGVESFANLQQNVGFWKGTRLLRLSWRPSAPYIALDMCTTPVGIAIAAIHRLMLIEKVKNIGETNSALELLKHCGADPLAAVEKWPKLYPPHCTDTASLLCHTDVFDEAYYKGEIRTLEVIDKPPERTEASNSSQDAKIDDSKVNLNKPNMYYAWNNDKMVIHMMKHCYKHEMQRLKSGTKLKDLLVGPRTEFRNAGKHEIDCRTLLMACYLGHINTVAPLINECNVDANLTDLLGNSALMYAACGDHPKIIHFLVEAGANVDGYNDSCCTALAVTLLRYACTRRDIAPSAMSQAITPATVPPYVTEATFEGVVEWFISREPQAYIKIINSLRSASKLVKLGPPATLPKKNRSNLLIEDASVSKKRLDSSNVKLAEKTDVSSMNQEQRFHQILLDDYSTKVSELFSTPNAVNHVPYIFDIQDMTPNIDIYISDEDVKKVDKPDKVAKNTSSKVIKVVKSRNSKDAISQSLEKSLQISSMEKLKVDREIQMMNTIEQLLEDGADPRKVRCPQSALFIGTVANNPDLVETLIKYGADVNEICLPTLGYTPLHIAITGPLTPQTVQVVRVLLKSGARVNNRLPVISHERDIEADPGPTLLHAVLAKHVEQEMEQEYLEELLKLLLDFGCDPLIQYKGRSTIEVVMSKCFDFLNIFVQAAVTDLNGIINEDNQTALVKMFYLPFCKNIPTDERLPMLTNLLLYGADPLIKCQNKEFEYDNLFVFTKEVLQSYEPKATGKESPPGGNKRKEDKKAKNEPKPKKSDKPSKDSVPANKNKNAADEFADYKQAVDLVIDCARILYVRWLQGKLMKNIIDLVDKYKHRHWNIIMMDYKNKKSTGLWLTSYRCLEIWDVLKTTRKKQYNDRTILKYTMCIANYCNKKVKKLLWGSKLSFEDKLSIETEVVRAIHEHNVAMTTSVDMTPLKKQYVTPELCENEGKFNICFECALPHREENIICSSCKLIAFCSLECMKINIDRPNCHPCSSYLKLKYFPSPEEGDDDDVPSGF